MAMYDRHALIELIRERALRLGDFVLASGQRSHYYLDCRQITLDGRGVLLVADGILERIQEDLPDAIGGMAIGADPITAAVIVRATQVGRALKGFIVRKEAKGHGAKRCVEGPVLPGERAVIVEDVLTTAGSALQAIDRAVEFGLQVSRVITIVDRLEGGEAALSERGIALQSLLTIRDLGVEPRTT